MHIYAFGSICRGQVAIDSDIDLLAIVSRRDERLDPEKFSIYSYSRIEEIWRKGNPFAWHLSLESRLIFAVDGLDVLKSLGRPSRYSSCLTDCEKFFNAFREARISLYRDLSTSVFDLSTVFLSVRNIATCFRLGVLNEPDFSRHSALDLPLEFVLPISDECYRILERSRILCTRGAGLNIEEIELSLALSELGEIENWMAKLVKRATDHERVR
jgi:hypothetical protein